MTEKQYLVFSIIIPAYKRPGLLQQCLQSLQRLEFPSDQWEVIVSDDGSKQMNRPVAGLLEQQLKITFITNENAGPAAARNRGAAVATADYLVFLDDDCCPDPQFLNALYPHLAPHRMLGGHTTNKIDNKYSIASQLLTDYLYNYFNSPKPAFFTSNNMVVARDPFKKIGGFDESFLLAAGEDRAFCLDWLRNGYDMVYVPEAVVYHFHSLTFSKFWKQQKNYGMGAKQLYRKRKSESNSKKRKWFRFYKGLLLYPYQQKQLGFFKSVQLSSLFLLSQLANTVGYFKK